MDSNADHKAAPPLGVALTEGLGLVNEADVIADMKKLADAFGLWAEVKESYDVYRAVGDHPRLAAMCALYDWDL